MPLRKFELIHRYLRLYDYTKVDETDEGNLPKVFQAVEEWSDHIQRISAELCDPGSHLAVDECMIRYTGRSHDITFIRNKPTPLGFKIWVVAQYGFFIHWLWHVKDSPYGIAAIPKKKGRKALIAPVTNDKMIPLNNTQAVVVALVNMLPKGRYHVFVDNLFSSADLFRSLRAHGYGATGTARVNCGIYKELKEEKQKDVKGKCRYGFNELKAIPTADNKVNQIAWKDNALVLFLSTVFMGNERVEKKRKKPSTDHSRARPIQLFFGDEAVKVISIPTVAAEYNDEMNHVDRGDQLRSYTSFDHRIRRGPWQALAWSFLLEVILVNTYLLQLHAPQLNWQRHTNQIEWRECIYNALFNTFHRQSQARKRNRSGDEFDEDDHQHHQNHYNRDINHINRGHCSACLACQGFRQGQIRARSHKKRRSKEVSRDARKKPFRRQTRYGCAICDVAICNSQNCWDFYHHLI
ncbi:hypothetical protein LCI18_007370 [Fusarium solani-melongenae]|uniref:Uncharacterized protein n=1 Tax=Fusarium solani subsp. cucurbitae TaxID=2747967 RepID=A0ACD3Z5F0_FUSSC|nr:hypothetical protein LCI18_007370 [Fusarium solani-melongenae]